MQIMPAANTELEKLANTLSILSNAAEKFGTTFVRVSEKGEVTATSRIAEMREQIEGMLSAIKSGYSSTGGDNLNDFLYNFSTFVNRIGNFSKTNNKQVLENVGLFKTSMEEVSKLFEGTDISDANYEAFDKIAEGVERLSAALYKKTGASSTWIGDSLAGINAAVKALDKDGLKNMTALVSNLGTKLASSDLSNVAALRKSIMELSALQGQAGTDTKRKTMAQDTIAQLETIKESLATAVDAIQTKRKDAETALLTEINSVTSAWGEQANVVNGINAALEKQLATIREIETAAKGAAVAQKQVAKSDEADNASVQKQTMANQLYRDQLGIIRLILSAQTALKKQPDDPESQQLKTNIELLKEKLLTLEQIKQQTAETDRAAYRAFETKQLAGMAGIQKNDRDLYLQEQARAVQELSARVQAAALAMGDFKRSAASMTPDDANEQLESMRREVDGIAEAMQHVDQNAPGFKALVTQIEKVSGAIDTARTKMRGKISLKDMFSGSEQETTQFVGRISSLIHRQLARAFHMAFRDGIQFAKEFGDALNEIQIVTLKTGEEATALGESYARIAEEMKLTTVEVTKSAVSLYRQGLNDAQVQQRLRQGIMFAKVAATDTQKAVDTITVAINTGMVKSAKQATDVLVALGDAAATDKRMAA